MKIRPAPTLFAILITLAGLPGSLPVSAVEEDPINAAIESLDQYMAAFNARDPEAWAATLNYPHIRMAGGTVRITETAEQFAAEMDFEAFAARTGWHHSVWDKRDVIHAGPDKVHFATTFTRYDKDGNTIASYDSLYIVTKQDGHWGTLARSSFAP